MSRRPAWSAQGERRATYFNVVGADYFTTLGIPVVRGRGVLTEDDRAGAAGTVVLNETAARRFWPDRSALGQRVSVDGPDGPWRTVVGVVRDAKYNSVGEDTPPFLYLPHGQQPRASMVLHVRAADGATAVALRRSVRALVTRLDPLLPPPAVADVTDDMAVSLLPARIGAGVTAVVGVVALLLAAVGIYGVVAFAVARRTREIGVRAALGAAPVKLVRTMMQETGRPVIVGLAVGIALALGAGRLMASVLYGVGAVDGLTLVVTPLVLGTAALVAAYLPARRAVRVSPTVALRAE